MRSFSTIIVSCALALVALQGVDARSKPLRARTCRSHLPAGAAVSSAVAKTAVVSPSPASSFVRISTAPAVPASSKAAAPVVSTPAAQPKPKTTTAPAPEPKTSAAAAQPKSSPPSQSSSNTSGGGTVSSSDIQTYLDAHNSVRAQHGAVNLVWNNTLEAAAQSWANRCQFVHSGGQLGPFGENLAAGTGGETIQQGVQSWADEASQYSSSNPVPSHFTQMVWKSSTQLGCAVASCEGIFAASFGPANFYVCEYFPQGNVIGEFAQNVSA